MTIQVTKEPINLREKLNELETNKGLKGNEILQAETAQEVRSLIGAGRKNLIINGGFDVWQRGTSGTKSGDGYGGYLSADRWSSYYDGTVVSVQEDVTVDNALVNTLRVQAAGSTGRMYAYSNIEKGAKLISGKPISISFWIKGSKALTIRNQVRVFNANSTYSGVHVTTIGNLSVTTTWQKVTYNNINITDSSLTGSRWAGLWFYDSNNEEGTDAWFEIANVQLELGSVATDFEHRSYGEELALCQRFYQVVESSNNLYAAASISNTPRLHYAFPTTMRTNPTIVFTGSDAASWNTAAGTSSMVSSYSSGGSVDKLVPTVKADAEL